MYNERKEQTLNKYFITPSPQDDLHIVKKFCKPQLYNVWNFHNRSKKLGDKHDGNIPGQIPLNVLYYYSNENDIIVDPMAGGGSTIDACKVLNRKYKAYDIEPKRNDIIKHNINNGYPEETNQCDLIFLDPPYFNMIKSIQNYKSYDEFLEFEKKLAINSFKTVKNDGIVAFIIQDMTEKANICLSGDSYKIFTNVGFKCIDHISCPLSTQQFLPQQVIKAKKNKKMMGRNRDLYIFKKELNKEGIKNGKTRNNT